MNNITTAVKTSLSALFSIRFWRAVGGYFGIGKRGGEVDLDSPNLLGEFLDSRASHVAQTALYGYMKTRAGTGFPALFEDSAMLASINIAKWQIWLACLSDLAVYGGVLVRLRTGEPAGVIRGMLEGVVARVLEAGGARAADEAGDDFAAGVRQVRERIAACDFDALRDDESAFTESPRAVVYWSPVADELKNRDVEIVRNSVRFRWQEVRRDLRRRLRAEALVSGVDADG